MTRKQRAGHRRAWPLLAGLMLGLAVAALSSRAHIDAAIAAAMAR